MLRAVYGKRIGLALAGILAGAVMGLAFADVAHAGRSGGGGFHGGGGGGAVSTVAGVGGGAASMVGGVGGGFPRWRGRRFPYGRGLSFGCWFSRWELSYLPR